MIVVEPVDIVRSTACAPFRTSRALLEWATAPWTVQTTGENSITTAEAETEETATAGVGHLITAVGDAVLETATMIGIIRGIVVITITTTTEAGPEATAEEGIVTVEIAEGAIGGPGTGLGIRGIAPGIVLVIGQGIAPGIDPPVGTDRARGPGIEEIAMAEEGAGNINPEAQGTAEVVVGAIAAAQATIGKSAVLAMVEVRVVT